MKMKPLNHKERRKAIWKFFLSLIPFLITMPLFVYIYCITAKAHSKFVEHKYEVQNKKHERQEKTQKNINKIFSLFDILTKEYDVGEYEYRNRSAKMTKLVQGSLVEIDKEETGNCFKLIFETMKLPQLVVDSVYENKSGIKKLRKKLKKCHKSHKEGSLVLLKD